jgi:hypothetical protein
LRTALLRRFLLNRSVTAVSMRSTWFGRGLVEVGRGPVRRRLAVTRRDRLGRELANGVGDGAESQAPRMAFASGGVFQDALRHMRFADLLSVPRRQGVPRFVEHSAQELNCFWIVRSTVSHEGCAPKAVAPLYPGIERRSFCGCVTQAITTSRARFRRRRPAAMDRRPLTAERSSSRRYPERLFHVPDTGVRQRLLLEKGRSMKVACMVLSALLVWSAAHSRHRHCPLETA